MSVLALVDTNSGAAMVAVAPTPAAANEVNELALNATTPKAGKPFAFCPAASKLVVPNAPLASTVVL